MGPSGSIVLVAAVQFLGSAAILFVDGQFLWGWIKSVHLHPVNHQVLDPAVWVAFIAVPIGFSLLGVVTAIGLLKLREWARRRTILLSTVPVLGGAVLAVLRPPSLFPPPGPLTGIVFVVFMYILVFLTPVSVWWLIVMTRKSVRAQFR